MVQLKDYYQKRCRLWEYRVRGQVRSHWSCFHVLSCIACGKILQHDLAREDCPDG